MAITTMIMHLLFNEEQINTGFFINRQTTWLRTRRTRRWMITHVKYIPILKQNIIFSANFHRVLSNIVHFVHLKIIIYILWHSFRQSVIQNTRIWILFATATTVHNRNMKWCDKYKLTTVIPCSPLNTLIDGHCTLNNIMPAGYEGPVGHAGRAPHIDTLSNSMTIGHSRISHSHWQ